MGIEPVVPSELPILSLRGTVVYPLTVIPLNVSQSRSIKLLHDVLMSSSRFVGLVAMKNDKIEDPGPTDVYTIGTASIIHRLIHVSDNSVQLIIQGIDRIRIKEFTSVDPYFKAHVEIAAEKFTKNKEIYPFDFKMRTMANG